MKTVYIAMLAVAALPAAKAQDCSTWTNWDLRGTYAQSGSGFIDLSRAFPGAGLPAGTVPMFWVGAFTFDGYGGGAGWVMMNTAGNLLNIQLVDVTYSMKPDCSVRWIFSMKAKELGITVGPHHRWMVVAPQPGGPLELQQILSGTPPGMKAAPGFDIGVARRISM